MKLKRKYARLIIVLLAVNLLLVLLVPLLVRWYAPAFLVIADACVIVTLSMLTPYLRLRLLLCPHCGRGVARPYWRASESHQQFCPKCGKPFVFDDDPDENKN